MYKGKKILGVITARGGSKGIPRKNIKLLGGKPLIAYSIEVGKTLIPEIDLIVNTNDEEIAEIASQYGAKVPFIRPSYLAEDAIPTLDVLIHTLKFYQSRGQWYEAVLLLQPTSPFRTESFIREALDKFVRTDADSLVSVRKVPHEFNPHWVFEPDDKGMLHIATGEDLKEIIPRRQALPEAYYRDGNIYIIKTETILSGSLLGEKLVYIETPENIPYVNLDTMGDWEKAEKIIEKFK